MKHVVEATLAGPRIDDPAAPRTPDAVIDPTASIRPTPDSSPTAGIRVAASPAAHPYVRHSLLGPASDEPAALPPITLLPDPPVAGRPTGQWWPPAVLEPAWVTANASSFDLLHVHFGMESFSTDHLHNLLRALHEVNRPLVFTVHDLENPQLTDQSHHRAQLDIMVAAADEVITLTPGAAAVIAERWGRTATVIEHPYITLRDPLGSTPGTSGDDPAYAAGSPAAERGPVVSMHLRDLRPNIEGESACRALLAAADELRMTVPGLRVELRVNAAVRDPAALASIERLVSAAPHADLARHARLSDAELEASLAGVDVSVMPYRHGTHSGWLELCWDLAVPVAAPSIGFYSEQHPGGGVESFDWASPSSLAAALRRSLGVAPADPAGAPADPTGASADLDSPSASASADLGGAPADLSIAPADPAGARTALRRERWAWRLEQQTRIRDQHLAVYRRALDRHDLDRHDLARHADSRRAPAGRTLAEPSRS